MIYPIVDGREDNPSKVQIFNDQEGLTTVANLIISVDLDHMSTTTVTNPLFAGPNESNLVFNRTAYYYGSLNCLKETLQHMRADKSGIVSEPI